MTSIIPFFAAAASQPDITIETLTANALAFSPSTATASYTLESSGDITYTGGSGEWIDPKIGMSNYEVFATLDSGTLSGGVAGAWQALSSDRIWTKESVAGIATAVITLEIRRIGTSIILGTATITLQAEVI